MNTLVRGVLLVLLAAFGILAIVASGPINPVTTTLGARTGTVLDGYGNTSIAGRPAECEAGAPPFPDAPDAWWQGFTPTVRIVSPVTGYRVWANIASPPVPSWCPHDTRTEVYRGFYEFDITSLLGQSGSIYKAQVQVKVRGTSVSPTSIAQPPILPVNAFLCDNATGGAFQLLRIPPATVFVNGFDINNSASTAPRIPNHYSLGTVVHNFPTKIPDDPGSGGSTRMWDVDYTQQLVSTLQAFEAANTNPPAPPGFAKIVFMMAGTNEPPGLKDAPMPFSDCRGAYSVELLIQK